MSKSQRSQLIYQIGETNTENILIKKADFGNIVYHSANSENYHTKGILKQLGLKYTEDKDNFIIVGLTRLTSTDSIQHNFNMH